MIDFQHVYKSYDGSTHALKDVSFKVEKGEFVFLTGPSGAGKTTLFRLLSAHDKATSGAVEVARHKLTDFSRKELPLFRRRIGVIYQDFRLLVDRTIFENVALPLEIRGDNRTQIQKRVYEMLSRVGLGHKKNSYPAQLSGGEQQRVSIARALIHQPEVLVADEPTGNLDPELTEEIMDLLEQVNAQGTTIFVASHDRDLVKRRGKRVIQLKAGEITI